MEPESRGHDREGGEDGDRDAVLRLIDGQQGGVTGTLRGRGRITKYVVRLPEAQRAYDPVGTEPLCGEGRTGGPLASPSRVGTWSDPDAAGDDPVYWPREWPTGGRYS